ncbi:myo-inosose-2 dehydratase [Anabaena azotica]|uniref:myo-inosose-2 dehydratase n=1 Tax=Anabaena azotica TaxID=197653 RepID=UPI0039A668A0
MFANNERKMNNSAIFQKIRYIGRLSVLLVALLLIGITSVTPPATAATIGKNSVLVSLVPPTNKPAILDPTFDRTKVNLGITPTGWSNSDDLTIDLDPPIPFQQILSEMALSGFEGTQNAPKFPKAIKDLKRELKLRNLRISEPWVGTEFTIGKAQETRDEFDKQVDFMKKMNGNTIVVAELGGAVHQKKCVDPLVNRPRFNDQQWSDLLTGLNELGAKANANGMQLVYHPHIGTGVENFEDIDRLMKGTDPDKVKLLLDTGHLYYAGVDPLAVTKKYANRIKHVHLKNIRQSVLDESIKTGRSFLDSIREGIFTVPGDAAGAVKFQPILQELAKANYQGWLMVEAEQDPNKAEPLTYALMARKYLQKQIGF